MSLSKDLIELILHDGLAQAKYKNSKLVVLDQTLEVRPHGAVFLTRTKQNLSEARGFIATSQEAVIDNMGCSHWTPNIFRYGTYSDDVRKTIVGHSEKNLKQINTLVVDADFGDHKPRYSEAMLENFIIKKKDLFDPEIWPTAILETPHGYQAYYVLWKPVFIAKKGTRYPAIEAAKTVSEQLRQSVLKKLPQVDVGCNDLGFFRMPSDDTIKFYEPSLTADFSMLLDWAKDIENKKAAVIKPGSGPKQVDQPWFNALVHATVVHGDGDLGRNNTLLTMLLACYSSGWGQDRAYDLADEWNSKQPEPMRDREVRGILRSAYSGKYQGASKAYIELLMKRWAPEVRPFAHAGRQNWVKFAKPRHMREYSHVSEWVQDLVKYIHRLGARSTSLALKTADIREALKISRDSLNKTLDYVSEHGLLRVQRNRGRNGGLVLITMMMAGRQIEAGHSKQAQDWADFLAMTPDFHPAKKVQDQLDIVAQTMFWDG